MAEARKRSLDNDVSDITENGYTKINKSSTVDLYLQCDEKDFNYSAKLAAINQNWRKSIKIDSIPEDFSNEERRDTIKNGNVNILTDNKFSSIISNSKKEEYATSPTSKAHDEPELNDLWCNGKLDALKVDIITDQMNDSDSFDMPPGICPLLAYIHKNDHEHAQKLKYQLDSYLASSEVLKKDAPHVHVWMMSIELLNETLNCQACLCPTFLTPSNKTIDQVVWQCKKCQKFRSMRLFSFFDFHPIKLQQLLVIMYHWAFHTDVFSLFMSLQDSLTEPRFIRHLENFWFAIRRLCAKMVNLNIVNEPFSDCGKPVIIDSITLSKNVIIFAAHQIGTNDVRFKVFNSKNRRSPEKLINSWFSENASVYTPQNDVHLMITSVTNIVPLSEQPKIEPDSFDLQKYLLEEIYVNFTQEFYTIPNADIETLSKDELIENKDKLCLNVCAKEAMELMQLALDEIVWRNHFGQTEAEAFMNILQASTLHDCQDPTELTKSIGLDLNPKIICSNFESRKSSISQCETKLWYELRNNVCKSSVVKTSALLNDKSSFSHVNNTPAITAKETGLEVCLEEYYYASYHPVSSFDNDKCITDEQSAKCDLCNKVICNNVEFVKHLMLHIECCKGEQYNLGNFSQCKRCYRVFQTPFQMQCHLDEVHLCSHTSALVCKICCLKFHHLDALTLHMRSMHRKTDMPFICSLCYFRTSFYEDLINHFQKVHGSTSKLLCPYCLRMFDFVTKKRFFQHLLKHQNKRSIYSGHCKMCCLSFVSESHIKEHLDEAHRNSPDSPSGLKSHMLFQRTMIPNPELKIQNGCVTSKHKDGSSWQYINGRHLNLEQLKCIECRQFILKDHYSKSHKCSKCNFVTFCHKSYKDHMDLHVQSPPKSTLNNLTESNHEPMYCTCNYSTSNMAAMASHLVDCEYSICYNKPVHEIEAQMESFAKYNECSQMLTVLGLMRKTGNSFGHALKFNHCEISNAVEDFKCENSSKVVEELNFEKHENHGS